MVEVKNFFQEVDSHPEIRNFKLWKTELATFWVINSDPKVQDDMHYHENDDHIFMVLEDEGLVRTPHKGYTMKQFDIVVLTAGQPYQLCNTGEGRLLLLGAGELGCQRQTENPGAENSQPPAADRAGDRLAFFLARKKGE